MYNRIQKLLLTDYLDFSETVLVESCFAQVTRNGIGIREVQLGLTDQNLIIAGDFFDLHKQLRPVHPLDKEADIESMELISVLPLRFLTMKLCSRFTRNFIKVTLVTKRRMYFEFGGHLLRNFYFNIWADRIFALTKSKQVSYSSSSSSARLCGGEIKSLPAQNCQGLQRNGLEAGSQTNIQLAASRSSTKISRGFTEQTNVKSLRRRINNLSHDLRQQLQSMISVNNEKQEEKIRLIEKPDPELTLKAPLSEESKEKTVTEIFKRDSAQKDENSIDNNLWFPKHVEIN